MAAVPTPRQGYLAAVAFLCCATELAHGQKPACGPVGDLDVVEFRSTIFTAHRSLRVLLPPGYRDEANRRRQYPVLYLNDGQTAFGNCPGGDWQADRALADLLRDGRIRPMIIVGIDNGGRRARAKEYLPWGDEMLRPPEPEPSGKYYPAFLLDEVVPFVQHRYRIAPGAANRAVGGTQYGAGAALFAVMERPGSFGGMLLHNPSLSPDDFHLLRNAEMVKVWPRKVYLSRGSRGGDTARLEKLLHGKQTHVKVGPQRLADALLFLFGSGR